MKVIQDYNDVISKYDPSQNISRNVMTKYEKCKILGMRMEQLARGAPTLIQVSETCKTIQEIAVKELEEKKIPFMIMRTLPTGQKEYWKLADLVVPP